MSWNHFFGFFGGVYPRHRKSATRNKPIRDLPQPPERVVLSLAPEGEPECRPVVRPGTLVARGELIGAPSQNGTPVYASISGVVEAVEPWPAQGGGTPVSVVIRAEGNRPEARMRVLPPEERKGGALLEAVRMIGVGQMDGHAPALHLRLQAGMGRAKVLIVNGCESEPLITADHRLMAEDPEAVIGGANYLLKLLGAERCVIAVESNKLDAIEALQDRLPLRGGAVQVHTLKAKYPQGMERPLVRAVTGVKLAPGQSPLEAGAVVAGVTAAAAVFYGVEEGIPLLDRVVTVSGSSVVRPQNLRVPLGTELNELLRACGGCKDTPRVLLSGGPMTGRELDRLDLPVTSRTNALLALGPKESWGAQPNGVCLRCGRCVQCCPMGLMPLYFHLYRGRPDQLAPYHIENCMECGTCAYVCPAHIPLTRQIRQGKQGKEART